MNKNKKNTPIRESREMGMSSHDSLIEKAKESGNYDYRSDAFGSGVGFIGMDDLDKMRRRKVK